MSKALSLRSISFSGPIAWILLAFLVLPILVIPPASLTDQSYLSLPKDHLSIDHYARLFHSPVWIQAFFQSSVIGLSSALFAVLLGVSCTIGCWRLGNTVSIVIRALLILPMIIPSIVYALGISRLWVQVNLFDTMPGVILAHTVTGMPYVVMTTSAALAGFDPALERAARSLGASSMQSLIRVVLPNIKTGIVSGAIFAFMHSWDELVVVLFTASRQIVTVPRMIYDGINEQLDPIIASVATALILISIMLLCINLVLTGASARRRESVS
ncbi:ABC transporter permease [Bradyrhizobium sp. AZCC 2230]|uniref:ABC transporter permease n=1 Tax=Bradyrhizobium sp. AZCC 2230 TaxID=3117021 RepID=UPI002FF3BE7D